MLRIKIIAGIKSEDKDETMVVRDSLEQIVDWCDKHPLSPWISGVNKNGLTAPEPGTTVLACTVYETTYCFAKYLGDEKWERDGKYEEHWWPLYWMPIPKIL